MQNFQYILIPWCSFYIKCSTCSEQFMYKKNVTMHMMKIHGHPKPHAVSTYHKVHFYCLTCDSKLTVLPPQDLSWAKSAVNTVAEDFCLESAKHYKGQKDWHFYRTLFTERGTDSVILSEGLFIHGKNLTRKHRWDFRGLLTLRLLSK